MLDSESKSGDIATEGLLPNNGPDKKPYTIKSIDTVTIDMMREAAQREGMKISAWVSNRLREAAVRSLDGDIDSAINISSMGDTMNEILLMQRREELKWDAIEERMSEISKAQMAIMTKFISS
jgi:hypothetical protein